MLKYVKRASGNRGDTLIEVLFAVTVFSLVVVGSMSVMNQGSAAAERSLEITLVRQQIDSQAEALRYLNSSYITAFSANPNNIPVDSLADQWVKIKNSLSLNVSGLDDTTCPSSAPDDSFILNTKTTKDDIRFAKVGGGLPIFERAVSFSQVQYNNDVDKTINHADGIWIEAIKDGSDNQPGADYIDFHISACWDSPGQSNPVTIGTIVRLYEPTT